PCLITARSRSPTPVREGDDPLRQRNPLRTRPSRLICLLQWSELPRAVLVLAGQPALRVLAPQLDQLVGKLRREEQVAEELAANGGDAGVERAAKQSDAGRARGATEARVALPVEMECAFPDRVPGSRRDDDVWNLLRLAPATGALELTIDERVHRRERLNVVYERVDEHGLEQLARSVERVRAFTARQSRRRRSKRGQRDHDDPIGSPRERRLDRGVEA